MTRTAEALLKISEALAEIAYDLGQNEQPRAGSGNAPALASSPNLGAPGAPRPVASPLDAEIAAARPVAFQAATDPAAFCPVHGLSWSVRPAGVSKAGKPYSAFYKCDEKVGDEWCQQKPPKAWVDAHPPRNAAA